MHSTFLECEPNEVDESFIDESEDGLDKAHESLSMTVSHEQLSAASDDDDEVTEEFAALPDWDVSRIDERCLAQQLPAVSANPSELFNLYKLMHGCSDRAAIDFFELAKLGLNLSKMRQTDISRATGLVSRITEYMRCRECTTLMEGSQCPQGCLDTDDGDSFAVADLRDQLQKLLDGKTLKFWDDSFYRRGGIIGDCTDGSAHREFMKKALLTAGGCKVLTFTLNTDGVQLFENSDKSIWPFLLAVNELPKEIRFLVQNVLVYAIWEGKKGEKQDVPFDSVLEHLANDLEKINRIGISLRANGKMETVKFFVTRVVADLPAKAEMLNMVYQNGFYGCGICESAGFTASRGNGHNHSYAPQAGVPPGRRRTHKTDDEAIKETVRIRRGVVKKIIKMWMKKDGEKSCRLSDEEGALILERMKAIKMPSSMSSLPSSFKLSEWKGHDFRNWLLIASLPCCDGIVKKEYLKHWGLLVESIGLLSKSEISVAEDLPRAGSLLSRFCAEYPALYGDSAYGINTHYLEHLAEYVELHGSLAESSLFAFESLNGFLTRQCHGTNTVRKTLLRQVLSYQTLRRQMQSVTEPSEKRFIARLRRQR
ncbi:hypothetical protein BV898_11547 [Hypsibius exemplaris]|uniref:Uncharacterized protein n=1 Tax=Hypsibius exemplaris TaxID=2072580 RepID=A0A1W0WGD7_HYPEX|nr:hypothetical protein BV898_11547 [Hypsibius exemplaris]